MVGLLLGSVAMAGLFLAIQRVAQRNLRRANLSPLADLVKARLSLAYTSIKAGNTSRGPEAGSQGTARRASPPITLTVRVLPTSDGLAGRGMYSDRYPKGVSIPSAAAFADQIAAYGAAYRVWIVPRGWTGSAAVGADGSTAVDLHPPHGSAKSGPRFHYEDTGGCAGCAVYGAAPYFPCALKEYKEFPLPGPVSAVPHGLKVAPLSPSLVTYTGSEGGGLLVRGVIHFACGTDQPFFQQGEFVLPRLDAKLLHFLLHTFVSREKLK